MKPLIALLASFFLCSCADMLVTNTQVAGSGGHNIVAGDSKDGVHMVVNCGIGAPPPKAIYIRPFCIDTAVFTGNQGASYGEMPIRKAIIPWEFAGDLKEQLEKLAPARVLQEDETPRMGWLIEGEFTVVDGSFSSRLALHVKVTDVAKRRTVYEFDMAGGSHAERSLRASGYGATHFDLENAAERIYLVLEPNAFRYGKRTSLALQ
jgi:hypothetical protein